jgi:hypothetical protein
MPIRYCPKSAIHLETESMSPGGRGCWFARIPADHTIDDVLRPEYFGLMQTENQMGKVLHRGDEIFVEPEDMRWAIVLRVMGLRFAVKQVLTREQQRWDFTVKAPPGFRLQWKGDVEGGRWHIFKGETLIDGGFYTEDEALARIEDLQSEKAVA